MKLNISMLILVFLSFFNIGAVSTDNMKICCFKDLEIRCKNDSSFVENGINIQYTTENSIKQERDIICKYIQSNFVVNNYQINENEISFDEKEIKIKVDLWNDNQYTYVVLTAINSNKSCNTEQLANMFKDLIDDDSQYQFIYDYLALNKVEIEGFTPPANNPLADDAPETSADETISETASVSNHVESEEELSFIKMYMEEMEALPNLSKDEEADLIDKLLAGDTSVSSKIVEANLSLVAEIAESHRGKGVNFGDLIQEGNVGLMLAVSDYTESVGDFHSFISGRIEDAIKNTVNVQINSDRIGQHLADKLNRLDEVTKNLSEKLGRVPELDELAKAMNISKDEASILLKTSLDTLSVNEDTQITDGSEANGASDEISTEEAFARPEKDPLEWRVNKK